eukprot:m.32559 g.32559  ORF g.32559 m.32559 type:complete len:260 (-) comp7058_c0_seq1:1846-2625(-)
MRVAVAALAVLAGCVSAIPVPQDDTVVIEDVVTPSGEYEIVESLDLFLGNRKHKGEHVDLAPHAKTDKAHPKGMSPPPHDDGKGMPPPPHGNETVPPPPHDDGKGMPPPPHGNDTMPPPHHDDKNGTVSPSPKTGKGMSSPKSGKGMSSPSIDILPGVATPTDLPQELVLDVSGAAQVDGASQPVTTQSSPISFAVIGGAAVAGVLLLVAVAAGVRKLMKKKEGTKLSRFLSMNSIKDTDDLGLLVNWNPDSDIVGVWN